MTHEDPIRLFIAQWFRRLDRLDPPETFLPFLDPEVEWNLPDADHTLHGHDRFLAWYQSILDVVEPPCTHHVSNIVVDKDTVEFDVCVEARLVSGQVMHERAHETWLFTTTAGGSISIKRYSADPINKDETQ
ncbi:nuclear transport factor 2 family protein [Pseudovibrio exalbescens]|uniref:nuclear transport factor 2 family protein n=1 Tax=Pseudovibrio exalbescens TaxID=197461 RepID=UPI0023662691|nr:nuclear transport factor 2 family protein [Pseudovibrio exalbescens]MDD7911531.1 nuclear transport factor 2 family protein [Pseudovibrio exalbescens]